MRSENDSFENISILVEDDKNSKVLFSIILENKCKKFFQSKREEEAVDILMQNSEIDLILMDIQLPRNKGLATTKIIREFNKGIIIIAQTAYTLDNEDEKALEAECNDYFSKPMRKKELYAIINKNLCK